VLSAFSTQPSAVEITVECNPSSFDRRVASGLLAAGVNRISLGIQSLDDAQLAFLGRRHNRELALDALDIALESGIPRVSADCLFGLPQQNLEDELSQIEHLARLPLSHLSAYALTIEEGTPFGRLAKAGRLPIAVEDRVADAFLAVHQLLEAHGYEHYEISNFARPGQRSLHNQQYWWGLPYLALGAGAVGAVALGERWLRYRNPANVRKYLALPFADPAFDVFSEAPAGALESVEWLAPDTRLRERIMLGLRLVDGLDIDAAGTELGVLGLTPERQRATQRLIANGRLSNLGSRYFIDPKAWLLADGTIAQLM
jgi:oxygen-independent coproporphyrinogen-3 oxidase